MAEELPIDPARTAILAMDFQQAIVAGYTGMSETLERVAAVLESARGSGLPIIYVQVGFRSGYPEVSPRNLAFNAIRRSGRFQSEAGTEIHPAVAPMEGEAVVTKHRVSAFMGTDLEMILRSAEIDTLVLFGVATSGVVLSTVRYAADADYRIIVVGDCCADRDEEVHRVLLEKVFPRQGTVVTADELIAVL